MKKVITAAVALAAVAFTANASVVNTAHNNVEISHADRNEAGLYYFGYVKELESKGLIPKLDYSKSLPGVDANNNGIRDDLELFTDNLFKEENKNKAAKQLLSDFNQIYTIDISNKEQMIRQGQIFFNTKNCVMKNFKDVKELEEITNLSLYLRNTPARDSYSNKYLKSAYAALEGVEEYKLKDGHTGCKWEDDEYDKQQNELKKKKKKKK